MGNDVTSAGDSDHGRGTVYISVRRKLRSLIDTRPRLIFPIIRKTTALGKALVCRDTQLVVEGYPRSANTFAYAAFVQAQRDAGQPPIHVAHHVHMPAQIVMAARLGIAAVVVIRQPEAAALSFALMDRRISLKDALADYIHYYRSVAPYHQSFVLGTFEQVTQDFGAVTRRINEKFDKNFAVFDHTDSNRDAVFDQMKTQMNEQDGKDVTHGAFPAETKQRMQAGLAEMLRQPANQKLLGRAEEVYRGILETCGERDADDVEGVRHA